MKYGYRRLARIASLKNFDEGFQDASVLQILTISYSMTVKYQIQLGSGFESKSTLRGN